MIRNKIYLLLGMSVIMFMIGCKGKKDSRKVGKALSHPRSANIKRDLPKRIRKLSNLNVYSLQQSVADTIAFKRSGVFKSTKHVYINGLTGPTAVDDNNRVYIAAEKPNAAEAIYVFRPDGQFIEKIGRFGKGRGEFLSISSLSIHNHKLYVYDPHQARISVFSLQNFELINDWIIRRDSLAERSKSYSYRLGPKLFVLPGGDFLKDFTKAGHHNKKTFYYKIAPNGEIVPGMVMSLKKFHTYQTGMKRTPKGYVILPFTMPFSYSSLIAIGDDGSIYTNWTRDFLIKIYDKRGHYKRAFYYAYANSPLSISNIDVKKSRKQFLTNENIPGSWPAIHTMFLDDQNRIWVLTITDNKVKYDGWVLNKKGELLATFHWPGQRASRYVGTQPLMIMKNGYFYVRETNLRKGIDQIVKYKIRFRSVDHE